MIKSNSIALKPGFTKEIQYCLGELDTTVMYFSQELEMAIQLPLTQFVKCINNPSFIMLNKELILNMAHIQKIDMQSNRIIMDGDFTVQLTSEEIKKLMKQLGRHIIN